MISLRLSSFWSGSLREVSENRPFDREDMDEIFYGACGMGLDLGRRLKMSTEEKAGFKKRMK